METRTHSAGSGIPARGLSSTDRARRGIIGTQSYGPLLRLADNIHGLVDARRTDAPLASLPWCQRLQQTYVENCHRMLDGTRDVLAPQITDISTGHRQLAALTTRLAELENELDAVRAEERPHGNGERHLPPEAISARAERRAEGVRARLRSEQARLVSEEASLQERVTLAEAKVEEEFGMAVAIAVRMKSFYQRRLQTYARRFLGRRDDLDGLDHELSIPAWAKGPCPWIAHVPATDSKVTPLFG